MAKVLNVMFENGDFDHVRGLENVGDTSFMEKGVYYPTQFKDVNKTAWAYVEKTELFKNGQVVDGLSFHFGGPYNTHGKVIGEEVVINVQNTNMDEVWCKTDEGVKLLSLINGEKADLQGVFYTKVDMEGIIKLDNGKFLIKDYGKYKSGLCFIAEKPIIQWQKISQSELNYSDGDFVVVYGMYYKSKKGTDCFKVMPKSVAPHMLVCDNWGGPFDKYRGYTLEEDKALYYRRASSNGGGSGYDYAVYDKGFTNKISEEDI